MQTKDLVLELAKSKMVGQEIANYQAAAELLETVRGWKDANEQLRICGQVIDELQRRQDREASLLAQKRKAIEARRRLYTAAVLGICALVIIGILLYTVIIPACTYSYAASLMDKGQLEDAVRIFQKLDGYKDSTSKIRECNTRIKDRDYDRAMALLEEGNSVEAYKALIALDGYKDSAAAARSVLNSSDYKAEILATAKIGDTVSFGTYEQDNDPNNGKEAVDWLVLDIQYGKMLVISKRALECKPYHAEDEAVTWEACTLREWLNDDFLNTAFSPEERAMIPVMTISSDPGTTQDRVFLLSSEDANKYLPTPAEKQCQPTPHAETYGVWCSRINGNCWWWLRSPGHSQNDAASVDENGNIGPYGTVNYDNRAVRPAMWINISPKAASATEEETQNAVYPQLQAAKAGDTLFFGTYEQDNNPSNGRESLEWIVLDVQPDKVLLLTKDAIDCKAYHTANTDITWETCSLRQWLNGEFLSVSFTSVEKSMIIQAVVSPDKAIGNTVSPGNTTTDCAFLLSTSEVSNYLPNANMRLCKPTELAKAQGAKLGDNGSCLWWLRSPGASQNSAVYVNGKGDTSEHAYCTVSGAVRPAVWLRLDP